MELYLYAIVVLATLAAIPVGLQIVMTRLYGWRGLAFTTTAVVLSVLVGPAMLIAWANGRFGSVPRPGVLTGELINLVNVFPALLPLTFLMPSFICARHISVAGAHC